MTGLDIFKIASSFLYESDGDDADSKAFAVSFLNVLLQESLDTENSIRRFKGTTELTEAPYLTALTENIDYDGAITRIALPYGLAAFFFKEAMDTEAENLYRNMYKTALAKAGKATSSTIEDQYSFPDEQIWGDE